MAKAKQEDVDLNSTDARELLLRYIQSIQRIDNQIAELKADKADILSTAKDEGFNKKLINQAISEIRKQMKTDEMELSEKDMYLVIISQANIIEPV